MDTVNKFANATLTKKQTKQLKKQMEALQKEMADSVLETMKRAGKPVDVAEIIAAYPDNERRRSCKDDKELKLYISMGLGKLIQEERVRELPKAQDGRYLLEIA